MSFLGGLVLTLCRNGRTVFTERIVCQNKIEYEENSGNKRLDYVMCLVHQLLPPALFCAILRIIFFDWECWGRGGGGGVGGAPPRV